MWKLILNYGTQKSTYTGLFGILGALGIVIHPELTGHITAAAMGLIGIVNFFVDSRAEKECK